MNGNDRPSPPLSTSTPSPPSTHSSLSISPSPPCSSCSPPDALRQLSIAPEQGAEGKPQRTIPCVQCRRIRRVCKWIDGWAECERCSKQGIACSGPRRRGRTTLDEFHPEVEEHHLILSASSPTAEWTRRNLSFSLTHHLVDTCLHFASAMPFDGVDLSEFTHILRENGGNTSEMSAQHDLLAAICLFFGVQFTNHQAILGASVSAPSFDTVSDPADIHALSTSEIGALRYTPLRAVTSLIFERIDRLDFESASWQSAVDRLALAWMALEPLSAEDSAEERHALLGELLQRGLPLLDHEECVGDAAAYLTYVLQGLVRDEFRQSLLIDKPSRLSPASHARIYPHSDYSLTLFAIPDEIYAPFFFDPDPVRRTTPFIEYGQCIDGLEHYLHRLNAILLYAPLAFLLRSVDRCWAALDAFASFIDGEIARVLDDSRIENLSPSVRANRPAKFAFNLWACRLFALPTLHGCHAAVLRLDATDRVKRKSVDRIYVELNALARLAKRVMNGFIFTPVHSYFTAFRLAVALEPLKQFLPGWASNNIEERDLMLETLHFASFYLPEAVRLVDIINGKTSSPSPTAIISSIPSTPEDSSPPEST